MTPPQPPQLITQGASLILRIEGDVLSTNADSIRKVVNDFLERPAEIAGMKGFTVDLLTAKVIDSVGLNLIVELLRACRQAGCRLQVRHRNANVQRILMFTRLDQMLDVQQAA
jgi:anti-anti-sigma factor